jgi:D-glycero-D-manno-heptose 1,7-bisphosphate phosphatase
MKQIDDVHQALDDMLQAADVQIRGWYTCPHTKEMQCECRKPAPGLLVQAAREHALEMSASYMIGDHPHDTATGEQLGVTGLYVLTGHGRKHHHQLQEGTPVFESILEAAKWIVAASN